MNSAFGGGALVIALLAALGTVVVSVIAARTGQVRWRTLSRHTVYLTTAAVVVASAVLVHAFITHDFSLKYVQRFSDERMPVVYLVTAFWGGQPGSLLLWALILLVFGAVAVWSSQHRAPELMPWVHAVLGGIAAFFLTLLVFVTNPFEAFQVINTPAVGHGLNPLLQNYWMAIHPPCLLTGYASAGVPLAFGVGALLAGRQDVDWIKLTRRWLLITWMFLSVGNLLGGRWAYEELGWGGYWAWDPVENAAIMPWFTSTALLHSVMVQEHRGMLKRWNVFLLVVTFWLTIFGTFLTRSGVLESVHSFAESGIGPWFAGFVVFIAVGGAVLLWWRWKELAPSNSLESHASREQMFLLNNWAFLALMFVTLWGTVYPKINQVLTGTDSGIGPPWFNRFAIPLVLVLLLVMALGTLFAWRRGSARRVKRNIRVPLAATLVITPLLAWLYKAVRLDDLQPQGSTLGMVYATTAMALVVFNLAVIADEFGRGARSRRAKVGGSRAGAVFGLLAKHRRRYGGYLVHIGFVLIIFGIAGNAFKISQRTTLRAGESVPLGDYLMTFEGIDVEQHPDKIAYFATVSVRSCARAGDSVTLTDCGAPTTIRPGRFDYNDYANLGGLPDPSKLTTEVAILTTPFEDVYVAPSGMNVGEDVASFEMFVNPFTFWVWFGGIVLLGSVLLCMWPEAVRVRERARFGRLRPILDGVGLTSIVLLPVVLLLAGPLAGAQELRQADGDLDVVALGEGEVPAASPGIIAPMRTDGTEAQHLFERILCPCEGCGGKTLAHCPGTCAEGEHDRSEIRAWLASGMSGDEVTERIVAERGESALAIPRAALTGFVIPIACVLLGALAVFVAGRTLRRHPPSVPGPAAAVAAGANGGQVPTRAGVYEQRLAQELRELD